MLRDKPDWGLWEEEVCDRLGGHHVAASGATDYCKGDVKTDKWLIDCKYTSSTGYGLLLGTWNKISSWARNEGRLPCILLRVAGVRDKAIMRDQDFHELVNSLVIEPFPDSAKGQKSKVVGKTDEIELFRLGNELLVCVPFESVEKLMKVNDED